MIKGKSGKQLWGDIFSMQQMYNCTRKISTEELQDQHRRVAGLAQRSCRISTDELQDWHRGAAGLAQKSCRIGTEELQDQLRGAAGLAQGSCRIGTEELQDQHRRAAGLAQRSCRISTEKLQDQHRGPAGLAQRDASFSLWDATKLTSLLLQPLHTTLFALLEINAAFRVFRVCLQVFYSGFSTI